MNVNTYNTKNYKNKRNWTIGQSKPNSNPIKANLRKAKMNVNSLITKDYRKKDDFAVRKNKPNSNPIHERPKMNANAFSQKDYENETAFRPKKTNPNKANSPAPVVRVLYTLRGTATKLRRLLITLFGFGYAGLRHSGSVYFQCAYSCSASILEKSRKI